MICRIQVKPLCCHVQTEVSTSHLWGENSLFAALKWLVFREWTDRVGYLLKEDALYFPYSGGLLPWQPCVPEPAEMGWRHTPAASLRVDCATNPLETDWAPKHHRWQSWQYNLVTTLFLQNMHLLVSKGPETALRQTEGGVGQCVLCRETACSQGTTE